MTDTEELISRRVAYLSMFEYLRRQYERVASGEVGVVLGDLSLLPDGGSADPAALPDFLSCVEAVVAAESAGGYSDCFLKLDNE